MSESDRPRPVPAPPRPGPPAGSPAQPDYADLDQRPVTEHVAVFEAEHARLERELRTIDQV
ncbi:hypothetical protein [Blastococcus sp. SYSU D00820]